MAGTVLAPGTMVRFKKATDLLYPYGVVISMTDRGAIELATEGAPRYVWVVRDEIVVPVKPPAHPLRPMRKKLPYGLWTCEDGAEVLFNRDYEPIWRRFNGGRATAIENQRISKLTQEWFYTPLNTPWNNRESYARCNAILMHWGIDPVV